MEHGVNRTHGVRESESPGLGTDLADDFVRTQELFGEFLRGTCGTVSVRKRRMLVWVKGNLGKIKEILCYPKFKDSSFFTESLG